jgi:hypothetical protein
VLNLRARAIHARVGILEPARLSLPGRRASSPGLHVELQHRFVRQREPHLTQGGLKLTTGVASGNVRLQAAFLPPMPNPFSHRVQLAFTLNRTAKVSLRVFDVSGRMVRVIAQGEQHAGRHVAYWDGSDSRGNRVANGIYFARLSVGTDVRVHKLVLTR